MLNVRKLWNSTVAKEIQTLLWWFTTAFFGSFFKIKFLIRNSQFETWNKYEQEYQDLLISLIIKNRYTQSLFMRFKMLLFHRGFLWKRYKYYCSPKRLIYDWFPNSAALCRTSLSNIFYYKIDSLNCAFLKVIGPVRSLQRVSGVSRVVSRQFSAIQQLDGIQLNYYSICTVYIGVCSWIVPSTKSAFLLPWFFCFHVGSFHVTASPQPSH